MAYINANQAVKLMELRKACDNVEAMTLFLDIMEAINDKIADAANMAKGSLRHDVKTNFFREEMPNDRVMTIIVEKLSDKLMELGYRVVKENSTTLLIVWYSEK